MMVLDYSWKSFYTKAVAPRCETLYKKHCRTNTTPRKQREWLQPVPTSHHQTTSRWNERSASLPFVIRPHLFSIFKKKSPLLIKIVFTFTQKCNMTVLGSVFAAAHNLPLRFVSQTSKHLLSCNFSSYRIRLSSQQSIHMRYEDSEQHRAY